MAVTIHQDGTPGGVGPAAPEPPRVETASQTVTKAANAVRYVTDENGRQIGWRKLNALEDFDLTEIAAANAQNEQWMMRATIAFGVRQIDGEPVSKPANKAQLRAMVARLDDAGMTAILSLFVQQNGESDLPSGTDVERSKN